MGPPGPRSRSLPLICAGRIGGYREAPRCRESGERRGNLELPHDRGPDTLHDGAPRSDARAPTSAGREGPAPGCRAAPRQACGAQSPGEVGSGQGPRPQDPVAHTKKEVVLPHLRFTRDKRGYENTFVVHTGGGRRRGKPRARILYWFRTPPGVRLGRAALDEAAIRLIEEHNPDVEFDWTRILKGQDAPVEEKPLQQDRRGRQRPREFPPRPSPPRAPAPDARPQEVGQT